MSLIEVIGDRSEIQDVVVVNKITPVEVRPYGKREVVSFVRDGAQGSGSASFSGLFPPGFARRGDKFQVHLRRVARNSHLTIERPS